MSKNIPMSLEDNVMLASLIQKQIDEAKAARVTDYASGHDQAVEAVKALWKLVTAQARAQLETINNPTQETGNVNLF